MLGAIAFACVDSFGRCLEKSALYLEGIPDKRKRDMDVDELTADPSHRSQDSRKCELKLSEVMIETRTVFEDDQSMQKNKSKAKHFSKTFQRALRPTGTLDFSFKNHRKDYSMASVE